MASALGLHIEIEHKFVIDAEFDQEHFFAQVDRLGPITTADAKVDETYFLLEATPNLVYRHRYDEKHQDLTYKTFKQGDIEVRQEVRLALDLKSGNQKERVVAFLAPLGIHWQSELKKTLRVFKFSDCEVVYYVARTTEKVVTCVEFEALDASSVESALSTLARYEQLLGFADKQRSKRSLFQLLFEE